MSTVRRPLSLLHAVLAAASMVRPRYRPKFCRTRTCSQAFGHEGRCEGRVSTFGPIGKRPASKQPKGRRIAGTYRRVNRVNRGRS